MAAMALHESHSTTVGPAVPGVLSSLGGLTGQFWPTLIGAVVGAVIAGVIGLAAQWVNYKLLQRQAEAIKRDSDLASSLLITIKMIKMHSHIRNTMNVVREALHGNGACQPGPPNRWTALQPFATELPKIAFTDREAVFLMSTRTQMLAISTHEVVELYAMVADMVNKYSILRSELASTLRAETVIGQVGSVTLTRDERDRLMPRFIELDSLIANIERLAPEYLTESAKIIKSFQSFCVVKFGKDYLEFDLILS